MKEFTQTVPTRTVTFRGRQVPVPPNAMSRLSMMFGGVMSVGIRMEESLEQLRGLRDDLSRINDGNERIENGIHELALDIDEVKKNTTPLLSKLMRRRTKK